LDARFSVAKSVAGAVTNFPASNVLVEETRFEPFVSDVWTLGQAWKVEACAIAEFSRLTLSGDSIAERSFNFIKPRVIATWTISPQNTLELRAELQVAQLNFNETRRQQEGTLTTTFIEYSKFKLGTIRFQVTDMVGFRRDRFIYAGTRASGSLAQIVNRERKLDPLLQLSLSGKCLGSGPIKSIFAV
jgi:hypothetical protein